VAFLASPGALAQFASLVRDSKRQCATCHTDWADSFDRPGAILLMDKPTRPAAAAEETCRGCHDGSVGDSRRGVWLEHGHRLNAAPTAKIRVPEGTPLDDGKMVCRTCHTAHTVPAVDDVSKVIFLRSAREGGPCQQCHVDRAYGAEHASHPLARLPFDLPEELRAAHARTDSTDRTKMACQTCHAAHGAREEHLLVLATDGSKLCLTCHSKLQTENWKLDRPAEHPQNAVVKNPAQKAAITAMGTRLGPGDTLTCLSCHKMHEGKTGKTMLADTLADSALCIRCHEQRKGVLTSKHDLQSTRSTEVNLLKQTAEQSGSCGVCHAVHQFARAPKPGIADQSGRCITCHPAEPAGAKAGLAFGHPPDIDAAKLPPASKDLHLTPAIGATSKLAFQCTTCHDPHDTTHPAFLRQTKDKLCATCHEDRFSVAKTKHDFTPRPELTNGRGHTAAQDGTCGFCHAVHPSSGQDSLMMWAGTSQSPRNPDDLCVQCHRTDSLAREKPVAAFNHPTGEKVKPTTRPGAAVRFFNAKGHSDPAGFVACASCHDPHGGIAKQPAMLRVASPASNLCAQCHPQNMSLASGPHDARANKKWPAANASTDLCTSCHQPHSNDVAKGRFTVVTAAGMPRADAACVACHPASAWAATETAAPGRAMHPTTLPTTMPTGLKLTGAVLVSSIDPSKQAIGCQSCHNPHAPPAAPKLLRVATGQTASSLCTTCHTDANGLAQGMHATDALEASLSSKTNHGTKVTTRPTDRACSPCHATHAVQASQRTKLWSLELPPGRLDSDARCLSCHQENANPNRTLVIKHPEAPLRTLKWAKSPAATASAADGKLHCNVCHSAHGPQQAENAATADKTPPALDLRRAAKPMVRADVGQECKYCHGPDTTKLLLYWHVPQNRAARQNGR
jgi:predicted CXXCH cytochrome family protein